MGIIVEDIPYRRNGALSRIEEREHKTSDWSPAGWLQLIATRTG